MKYYENKVALITGGASGIGRAVAEKVSSAGGKVVVADHNGDEAQAVAKALDCEGCQLDVRDLQQTEELVEKITAEHGAIDLLFNNAGVTQTGEAHNFSYDDWKRVIDVNLYGVINGVHVVYPQMVERGSGHIINTASIAGLFPSAGQVSYVASKYGVVGLSHALRAEAAAYGVNVTVVCPGIIKTPMRDGLPVKGVSAQKVMDLLPEGMPVNECADEILEGVRKNEATIIVTPMAQILAGLRRLSPDLTIWVSEQMLNVLRSRAGE